MITVEGLTKKYGPTVAVDDVTFTAAPGRVTGFLGPNGAGKSTSMRVLVGLTRPTSGTATILGRRFVDLPNPGLEVGVLLDASAQHSGRTGREILTLSQQMMGLPARRVEEMLEVVSLTPTEASRRVRDYSLGMRQRLGIATALIGDPEVLILDEPANGLDPAGIRWMRDLLRGYANRGGTVLLSSHLLHEIEVIADDIVVIGQGRIVARSTKTDLLAGAGTVVRTRAADALTAALTAAEVPFTTHDTTGATLTLRVDADPERVGTVAQEAGVVLLELRPADGAGLGGHVPRAHRRHPKRKSSLMTTIAPPRPAPATTGACSTHRGSDTHPAVAHRPRRAAEVSGHESRCLVAGEHRHRRTARHQRRDLRSHPPTSSPTARSPWPSASPCR
jgi:ABC-2 type transport system ATP-binding protein